MEKINIEQLGEQLLTDKKFIHRLKTFLFGQQMNLTNNTIDLQELITSLRQVICQLIRCQLENQLKQMIEDNNRILKQIQSNLFKQNRAFPIHQVQLDISFTEVQRLMDEEQKKVFGSQQANRSSTQKSISAFVELKVENLTQKIIAIDKRLKYMQDKYQTNLKSIWNVLSISQNAVFDHVKICKVRSKLNQEKSEIPKENKSFFEALFKIGR